MIRYCSQKAPVVGRIKEEFGCMVDFDGKNPEWATLRVECWCMADSHCYTIWIKEKYPYHQTIDIASIHAVYLLVTWILKQYLNNQQCRLIYNNHQSNIMKDYNEGKS